MSEEADENGGEVPTEVLENGVESNCTILLLFSERLYAAKTARGAAQGKTNAFGEDVLFPKLVLNATEGDDCRVKPLVAPIDGCRLHLNGCAMALLPRRRVGRIKDIGVLRR